MKDISVIIPTYQHDKTIGACLDALLAQSLTPKEIIVIDDGSTDQTREVLSNYQEHIFSQFQENQGAPVARNNGAKLASGTYLLFCDADIIAKPVLLERMHEVLSSNPQVSFVYSGFYLGVKRFRAKPFNPATLRQHNYIHTTSLMRRSVFPGFDPRLKRFQDWDLWLTIMEQGQTGVPIDEELFRILQAKHRTSISTWIPSFVHTFPWHRLGWKPQTLKEYESASQIIKLKHSAKG